MHKITRASNWFAEDEAPIAEAVKIGRGAHHIWVTHLSIEEIVERYGTVIVSISGETDYRLEVQLYDAYVE